MFGLLFAICSGEVAALLLSRFNNVLGITLWCFDRVFIFALKVKLVIPMISGG
jgi:hypothetical protein